MNPFEENEANKSIEEIASKTIEQNESKTIEFKAYLDSLLSEENLLTTTLDKSITRNLMTGTDQLDQNFL